MKGMKNPLTKASVHRANARAALAGNWAIAVIVFFLAAILCGEGSALSIAPNTEMTSMFKYRIPTQLRTVLLGVLGAPLPVVYGFSAVMRLASLLLGGLLRTGCARYSLSRLDGKEAGVRDLFCGTNRFSAALVMHLLYTLLTLLGYFLLFFPGVILRYGLALAPCILAEDPACSGPEALRRSWQMMRGRKLELCCLEASFLGWMLLAGVTYGAVELFLQPYKAAALASFYRELAQNDKK